MSKGARIGLIVGLSCGILGAAIGIIAGVVIPNMKGSARTEPAVRLDYEGAYLILISEAADKDYADAVAVAKELHPGAEKLVFSPFKLSAVRERMKELKPKYALIFIHPDELDVNFAWQWLKLTVEIDEDPFVDVRTGFITGESPAAAAKFMRRIKDAAEGRLKLPGKIIDNLGPNMQAPKKAFFKNPASFMIPVMAERFGVETISHGVEGFTRDRLTSMDGAGIVHWGGHGYPDRVVNSMNGPFVRKLKLSPCVVFNGACYTGVTSKWFDSATGRLKEKKVQSDKSFCLGILTNSVIGYLASLHPDHGIPVYQEMEYMATCGASLGALIKHTHDGVVLGNGGKLPKFQELKTGMMMNRTPKSIMLNGTAARVLFGDPSFVLMPAFTGPPFDIDVKQVTDNRLEITATLKNTALKSTYTDTYHSDMSTTRQFNDRALVTCELPEGWTNVKAVEVIEVRAGGKTLKHKLIGSGVEIADDKRYLHVQVDMPSSGYMQSAFRQVGSIVKISANR